MIADLRAASDWLAHLWNAFTITRQVSEPNTILSPTVGPVTLDCDVLTAPQACAHHDNSAHATQHVRGGSVRADAEARPWQVPAAAS